jgi:signal transduction histidine kinase/CheY-like chemotaxis protein/HPt (histidine-containing phosphotransfer) domain-containing protein
MVRSTIDGFASEPSSILFRVRPPWWRTGLAFGVYCIGVIGIVAAAIRFRDHQQRRRTLLLEELVTGRTAQLQRANEAKTEFVTAMSHDVRTPINGIMGSTIELSRSQLGADQRVLVNRIEVCSKMLCGLVEDVLDFAAIESGQTLVADLAFSPARLLDSINVVLRSSAQASECLIESEVDPSLPYWLSGDEDRIRQVLVNYGSNAVKYAGAGLIKLRAKQDGNFVIFSVADRGPGISEHAQKKLFLRFSRITPESGKEGKGLGLAGCRAIARPMNGTVGVTSKIGEGAEFWLRIPMRESSPQEVLGNSRAEVMYDQRALLVEDIQFSAEASRSVLQTLGFEVVVVCSGQAAIERIRTERFDIVFLDINLPDLSGTEVASAILSLGGQLSSIKILATTAHATVEHKAECLKSGMSGFISKPLTPEKVRNALTRADISPKVEEQASSLVSFATLDFLSNGSRAELRKHADMLLSGIAEEMAALSAAASVMDREHIGRTAHRLITHARIAGDQSFIELAARLESTAPYESMDSINDQIIRIRSEIAVFKGRLEDHVHQAGSA